MTDDEHRLLGPFDEQPEGTCVAPRGVVETLAARERLRAAVRPLPAPVRLGRPALEVAQVDVVEQRFLELRHLAVSEREVGGLPRAREARMHAEIERELGDLMAQPLGFCQSLGGERHRDRRVAVHAALDIQCRMRVAGQQKEAQCGRAYATWL